MSVRYIPAAKIDPVNPEKPPKYYAKPKGGNKVKFEELIDVISKVSNLNYGQVVGALGAFMEVLEIELQQGREVELQSIGTFYLTLGSEGASHKDNLTVDKIKEARIRFRPGRRLKRMTRNLEFIKDS